MQLTTTSTSQYPLLARKPCKSEGVMSKSRIAELNYFASAHTITFRAILLVHKHSCVSGTNPRHASFARPPGPWNTLWFRASFAGSFDGSAGLLVVWGIRN